LIYTIKKQKV